MLRNYCVLSLLAILLLGTPVSSQDGLQSSSAGRGIIVEPNPIGTAGIGPLNPLLCSNPSCKRIADFLFPTLFATDAVTGEVVGASADNHALVLEPSLQAGDVQTLHLRGDLTWSDGTPVTAYDMFYSFLAILAGTGFYPTSGWLDDQIVGAQFVDDHTIAFQYAAPDCSSLPRTNFPVIPAHRFDPEFAAFVDEMKAASGEIQPTTAWLEAYSLERFGLLWLSDAAQIPSVTAGPFEFEGVHPAEEIRLLSGDTAFVYADAPSGISDVDLFLAGEANVLVNPDYERRDDLRAVPGLQIAEFPGGAWDYIVFNLADPLKPRDGFDVEGQPIEQGHHPLFGDHRVRRAVQLAIDVNELVELAFQGRATPLAANLPPVSWGFNADLRPSAYDPVAATRLLEEAGWKDWDDDGVRECHGCLYAEEGTWLSFDLISQFDEYLYLVEPVIARQLAKVGFNVNVYFEDMFAVQEQFFDAFLGSAFVGVDPEFSDPDQTQRFTRAGDVVGALGNVGSYYNEEVETLMEQGRTVADCDLATRAQIYRQIQPILQDDQPYAWLYARDEMVVAQGNILGFSPYPGRPFWNIRDWVVSR